MKLMVTGDQGYIGAVLVPILMTKGYEVIGYDAGYFTENTLQYLEDDYKRIKKIYEMLIRLILKGWTELSTLRGYQMIH